MAIYYIDQTAGDDSQDGTEQTHTTGTTGPWKTIAKVNASSFSGDDQILFKKGETWRETLTVPSSGTSGHQITFSAYGTGELPKFYGSSQISTWTNESGSLWYATSASDPLSVWYVNLDGTFHWGEAQAAKVNLDAEYEYWWDSGNSRVYVFAATDPDTRYTSIEKPTRNNAVNLNRKNYLTVSYLETAFCGLSGSMTVAAGIYQDGGANPGTSGIIVEYCTTHHNGQLSAAPQGNGMLLYNLNSSTIRYNTSYRNARRGLCTFATNPSRTLNNNVIEHNTIYDCYHGGIDIFLGSDALQADNITIRYNHVYATADYIQGYPSALSMHGILLQSDHATTKVTNSQIYYNLIVDQFINGGIVIRANNGTAILNNTIVGTRSPATDTFGIIVNNDTTPSSNIVIKNNIALNRLRGGLYVPDKTYISECDYNCWYDSEAANPFAVVNGVSYHFDDQAAYKSATGWDTNGLWEDPLLTDPTNGDYTLGASSPCIDAGVDVALTEDFAGNNVGVIPDIGAYEAAATPIVSASPIMF